MRERFIDKKFDESSMELIRWAVDTLDDYRRGGFTVTLRQLYYAGVSTNLFPNSEASYTRLGSVISDARMAGYVDWDMIVDRGRAMTDFTYWDTARDAFGNATEAFKLNKWKDQQMYVEVQCEKQALEGVLLPVCQKYQVPFTANKDTAAPRRCTTPRSGLGNKLVPVNRSTLPRGS